jgi:hypothetical protein
LRKTAEVALVVGYDIVDLFDAELDGQDQNAEFEEVEEEGEPGA